MQKSLKLGEATLKRAWPIIRLTPSLVPQFRKHAAIGHSEHHRPLLRIVRYQKANPRNGSPAMPRPGPRLKRLVSYWRIHKSPSAEHRQFPTRAHHLRRITDAKFRIYYLNRALGESSEAVQKRSREVLPLARALDNKSYSDEDEMWQEFERSMLEDECRRREKVSGSLYPQGEIPVPEIEMDNASLGIGVRYAEHKRNIPLITAKTQPLRKTSQPEENKSHNPFSWLSDMPSHGGLSEAKQYAKTSSIRFGSSKASLFEESRGQYATPSLIGFRARRTLHVTSILRKGTAVENTDTPTPSLSLRQIITGKRVAALACLLAGSLVGWALTWVIDPAAPPEPGSLEDEETTRIVREQADRLPIVQSLTSDHVWKSWDAYSGIADEAKPHRITTGPLGGSRGVGAYQRVWHNVDTGETIVVIWIGSATTGWPTVVHGGLLATLMDECLGRTAIACFDQKTGVTANLELNYRAPANSNSFYVIRTVPEFEGGLAHQIAGSSTPSPQSLEKKTGWLRWWGSSKGQESIKPKERRKMWVTGRLETLEGKVCVEARGLFVVPKRFQLKKLQEDF